MKHARSVQAEVISHPINSKFQSRLPSILNEISDRFLVIEPAIAELTVSLKEFLDYLDFEIQKSDLQVKRMQWEDKIDPASLAAEQDWLAKLQSLRKDFDIDVMTSPIATVRSMVDRVQKMFDV